MEIFRNRLFIFSTFLLSLYFSFVLILPQVLNIPAVQNKILSKLLYKNELSSDITNLNIKISPLLKINLKSDEILIKNKQNKILSIKGLDATIPLVKPNSGKINISELYFQKNKEPKSKRENFNFFKKISYIPNLKIDKFIFEYNENKLFKAEFFNIVYNKNKISELSFNLLLTIDDTTDKISVLDSNKIYISGSKIYTNNFNLNFDNSGILLNGTIYSKDGVDLNIFGKNIKTKKLVNLFVFVNRCIKNKKHFIENFKNFNGTADINLNIKNLSAFGEIKFKNLSATTILLSVPLSFHETIFKFRNNTVFMQTNGKLGMEDAYWNFFLTNLFTDKLAISGKVSSGVSDNFAKKYIEKLRIKNKLQVRVDYLIQNKVTNIVYNATLPAGSDILYYGTRLGLKDFDRNFQVITKKDKDVIKLVDYTYSVRKNNQITDIVSGYGEFEKINNKYTLTSLFGQTMNNAPLSLLGFLDGRFRGGYFNGNLEYDFKSNKLLGSIILENTKFKNFNIENGAVFADKENINLLSFGNFKNEPFTCEIILKNELSDKLLIEKLDLYLKKFTFDKDNRNSNKAKFKLPVYNRIVNAKNITLKLDTFKKDDLLIQNIVLNGYIQNNLFNFTMPDIHFAQGNLSAKGYLNFNNKNSDITFFANDINSNIAAYQIFKLKNQISGKADAKLFVSTKNLFKNINGYGEFKIKEGYLPQIGNIEFVKNKRKKSSKVLISDIVKIKKTAKINPKSNITGVFDFNDFSLENINLYLQNEILSMFIEGDCNTKNSFVNLNIYGKYDMEAIKDISIFHIPLSFLTKIVFKATDFTSSYIERFKKAPDIKAKKEKTGNFEITLKGSLDNKKGIMKTFLRNK